MPALLLLLLVSALVASLQPEFRLPATARPLRYTVDLTLDPRRDTFSGEVTIEIALRERTRTLWLNGKDLRVTAARLGETPVRVEAVAGEFLRVDLPRAAGPGTVRLGLSYAARLGDKVEGAFRQRDGENWYAFTQFAAIEARRAIPCFDEPGHKTPWTLTLHVPVGDTALSNTPMLSETTEADGRKTVRFATTRPLPAYLVAFAVGPFAVVDAGRAGQRATPLRIIVPRGRAREAASAAEAAGPLLEKLERYVGLPYPYDKMDHVALPTSRFGAMENAGLITYRLGGLLSPPERVTPVWRQSLDDVMAHELAHQWFGNLVTMAWWDDVWLSEGLTTYVSSQVRAPRLADVDAAATLLRRDGTSRRAVRRPMGSRADMADVYNGLVYQKGARVAAMMEAAVERARPGAFRLGLRTYLQRHADGSATTGDLLQALGPEHAALAHAYLDHPGAPVVDVSLECGAEGAQVRLHQAPPTEARHWPVPVCVRHPRGVACLSLARPDARLALGGACPAWVHPNADAKGHYRAVLAPELLRAFWQQGAAAVSPGERLWAARELDALLLSGRVPVADARALLPLVRSHGGPELADAAATLATDLLRVSPAVERTSLRSEFALSRVPDLSRRLEEAVDDMTAYVALLRSAARDPEDAATALEHVEQNRARLGPGALREVPALAAGLCDGESLLRLGRVLAKSSEGVRGEAEEQVRSCVALAAP